MLLQYADTHQRSSLFHTLLFFHSAISFFCAFVQPLLLCDRSLFYLFRSVSFSLSLPTFLSLTLGLRLGLSIDCWAPCHLSWLSILTWFGHPQSCGHPADTSGERRRAGVGGGRGDTLLWREGPNGGRKDGETRWKVRQRKREVKCSVCIFVLM